MPIVARSGKFTTPTTYKRLQRPKRLHHYTCDILSLSALALIVLRIGLAKLPFLGPAAALSSVSSARVGSPSTASPEGDESTNTLQTRLTTATIYLASQSDARDDKLRSIIAIGLPIPDLGQPQG